MYPIIDFHSTWLAVNPIQGCINKCDYCFLQSQNLTGIIPKIICSPQETIDKLLIHKYYKNDTPLAFFTQTDAFVTSKNIKYLKEILKIIEMKNIRNPIIFITKCRIPDSVIQMFSELQEKGFKIIAYLSYSGLENDIEKGINHENIRQNFINLFENQIPIIHYMRPIIPQNGTFEKMHEVIKFTSKYTNITIFVGLKVQKEFIDKIEFWEDIEDDAINKECIYPSSALENLEIIKKIFPNQKIFHANACGLASLLQESEKCGFFGNDECIKNDCTQKQRNLCKNFYSKKRTSEEDISYALITKCGHQNASWYFDANNNLLSISSAEITISEQAYIRNLLNVKLSVKTKKCYYWNTSINKNERDER